MEVSLKIVRTKFMVFSSVAVLALVSAITLTIWSLETGRGLPRPRARALPQPTTVVLEPISLPLPATRPPGPPGNVAAREALERAERLVAAGDGQRALAEIDELKGLLPRLGDRIALLEGRARSTGDRPDERACEAFGEAAESPLRSLAARARVERVRCLLARGDPPPWPGAESEGEKALSALRRRYPQLPQALQLELVRARAREAAEDLDGAADLYRDIDLRHPGSAEAREARARLGALAVKGVELQPFNLAERVNRLRSLLSTGPLDMAREEIQALRSMEKVPRGVTSQVAEVEALLAKKEGRFEAANTLLREARGASTGTAEERAEREEQAQLLAQAAAARDPARARADIKRLLGGRVMAKQPLGRLAAIVRLAARADLATEVDQALDVLLARRTVPPRVRFDAAVAASGVGDDERVARLFASVAGDRRLGVAARYHAARALERLGRLEEALPEYQQVAALDDEAGQGDVESVVFYAFWARQREQAVAAALEARGDSSACAGGGRCESRPAADEPPLDTPGACAAYRAGHGPEIAERLRPLAAAHGEAYPWLRRAVDLLELDRPADAAEELDETFAAWSDARGRELPTAGVEAVFRGGGRTPRHPMTFAIRRARLALQADDLAALAEISAAVGDEGLAIRFGGWRRAQGRPRAHEDAVRCAAARNGLDPNLLLAVMRVESVYNPRIISYAGAIGLMQIMPRTGTFISTRVPTEEPFTVDRLLEPELNIDFAAWYLASLVERFDGRVPLAIAAYNGGPHNVRLWMQDHSTRMPMESFLETIPFDQTHRYVRRVLTHYEAYRSQLGLPVAPMATTLPAHRPDPVAF
jgi:soluble lytic murein transglycosylase